eukprot:g39407.t1
MYDRSPNIRAWEINPVDLTFLRELGNGQFGVVKHGKWRGQYEVAIKMIKEGSMSEDDFIDEAETMITLHLLFAVTEEAPHYLTTSSEETHGQMTINTNPELQTKSANRKWDRVWGVLMWETFALGKTPYERFSNADVVDHILQGRRLYRPQQASESVYSIMYSCWDD